MSQNHFIDLDGLRVDPRAFHTIDVDMVDSPLLEAPRFLNGDAHLPQCSRDLHQLPICNIIYLSKIRGSSRKVHILTTYQCDTLECMCFCYAEDPGLLISGEVESWREVFQATYHFDVDVWRIPRDRSHRCLTRKVFDFIGLGGDNKDHLQIIY